MAFDILRRKKGKTQIGANKILIIIPGVTGDSEEAYIKDLVYEAYQNSFNVFTVNPLAPSLGDDEDFELLDFTRNEAIENIV